MSKAATLQNELIALAEKGIRPKGYAIPTDRWYHTWYELARQQNLPEHNPLRCLWDGMELDYFLFCGVGILKLEQVRTKCSCPDEA